MCGIFAFLNNNNAFSMDYIKTQFNKSKHRGPDMSNIRALHCLNTIFGFHRLSINGLDESSNQPITIDYITIICNGEIYNYKELYQKLNIIPKTKSDCEVIIHLYKKYGWEHTLQMLDGVFALILLDQADYKSTIYVARDPYGIRPLYMLQPSEIDQQHLDTSYIAIASELKSLRFLKKNPKSNISATPKTIDDTYKIAHIQPGTYTIINCAIHFPSQWKIISQNIRYSTIGFNPLKTLYNAESSLLQYIYTSLCHAVQKRVTTTDRPIACLLSGGLDSSIITALVCKYYSHDLETYSIGLTGSEDLKYSKKVADYLGTKHTQIEMTPQNFFDAIPDVIYAIESYDTTTVRASVGNYLVAKYISKHSKAKVIFNGDGADELAGGYMYFHSCPDMYEFDRECRRLLKDIHAFDVLRSDKCISAHGLEARTPFLDRSFVQTYMSFPPELRYHLNERRCEKYLLRKAFSEYDMIPEEILWRPKEAFSDGVSSKAKSWYEIIDELIVKQFTDKFDNDTWTYTHNPPTTREQRYYRYLFEKKFSGLGEIVPYFWMPQYVSAKDASARSLNIYNEKLLAN